jgi:hypothetical protein
MAKGFRVMYLRDKNKQPIGCLAIGLTRGNLSVKYQVSCLNPVDTFDRETARLFALGRLVESPFVVSLDGNVPNMHHISRVVMTDLSHNKLVPSRASRAAKRWLRSSIPDNSEV